MSQSSKKIDLTLPAGDVAAFLRTLADEMERGEIAVGGAAVDLGNFQGMKLSLKSMGETTRVKIKVKYPRTETLDYAVEYEGPALVEALVPDEAGTSAAVSAQRPAVKPKYKALKKTMGAQFKAIKAALATGALPEAGLARVFDHNSRVMCTYAGKGDAFYESYLAEQDRFIAAVDTGDAEAALAAVLELDRLKKECHARHK